MFCKSMITNMRFCISQTFSPNPPIMSSTTKSDVIMMSSPIPRQQTTNISFDWAENQTIIRASNNFKLHAKDFKNLATDAYTSEDTINFYLQLVQKRSQEDRSMLRVRVLSTHFVLQQGKSTSYAISQRQIKDFDMRDINSLDRILVPVFVGGNHWVMAAIYIKEKEINLYDSMSYKQHHMGILHALKGFMTTENAPFWRLSVEKFPKQKKSNDCGIFAMTCAEFISRNAAFSFEQEDMLRLRMKIMYEIMHGGIVNLI